jgi:MoxR-like ATPase
MSIPTFDIETVPAGEDRERIAGMIPNPRIADAYVHRTIEGMDDFDLFDVATEEQENVMLVGDTGSSKTTVFRAYAAARQLPFALVECHASMDHGTVVGKLTQDTNKMLRWMDGDLTLVARYGGVILLDEINMAHPRVMAAFKALISITRMMTLPENAETIKAGRGGLGAPQPVLLGGAYNDRYQGTSRLNEALLNQFAMQLEWGYDHDVEATLLDSASLLEIAENARSLADIRTPISTNSLKEFERHARRMGMRIARRMFVNRFAPEERTAITRNIDAAAGRIAAELDIENDIHEIV